MRRTGLLILMYFGCNIFLRSQSISRIFLQSSWEKVGLDGISNLDGRPNFKWKKVFQIEKPFLLENYQLHYCDIPVQYCIANVATKDNQVLVSIQNMKSKIFGNFSTPFSDNNLIWVYDSIQNNYELIKWEIVNRYQKKYTMLKNGEIQNIVDERRFLNTDTWTVAKVFRPDPLTTANILYGNGIKDRQDSSYAAIENQQIQVKLKCLFKNDSFRLENQWLKFGNISSPLTKLAVTNDKFNYLRNQSEFEEVNVFYHITNQQRWWDTLGFSAWKDTVILDAHAYFGADESAYNPLANPPTIEFGDGGVDDAEDADAPIHEYTHAAFNALVPNGYAGTQRQGVEEGICDFMAVCYSRKWSKNQADWVYNWDGHNEFFSGRTLQNNRIYPGSLTNQPHVDGQLFGAALNDLAAEIGDDSTIKLCLAAMPFLMPGISMKTATEILIQTDSFLNSGKTNWPIVKAFYPRGLLPKVGTLYPEKMQNFWVKNSEAFAIGGNAEIFTFQDETVFLMDAKGNIIQQFQLLKAEPTILSGSNFTSGLYFLKSKSTTLKLLRF